MIYKKFPECTGCSLEKEPGPVWGVGNPHTAKLIYIAQNPGQVEVETSPMQPLVGPAGNIFNMQCGKTGVPRSEMYITNLVKCKTPGNRQPSSGEIAHCSQFLERELTRCKADTVLLAGDVPAKHILGSYSTIHPHYKPAGTKGQPAGIHARKGCVEIKDDRKWIITPHPASLLHSWNPETEIECRDILQKAWRLSDTPLQIPRIYEHPSDAEVLQVVDKIILGTRAFSDDVETVGLENVDEDDYCGADFQLTMCGIGYSPTEAIVLDPAQIRLLSPIFIDSELWRYEHNGPYDNYHIAKYIGEQNMQAKCFDTMLGTHYLRSYAPKKLKPYVLSQYTSLPYYNRDLGKLNMRLYNGMDCIATFQAAKRQHYELKHHGLEELFFEFGMPLLPILEEMRRKGVNVDARKALLMKRITELKIAKANTLISRVAGPFFNSNSPKEVMRLLYEVHNLPIQTKPAPRGQVGKPTCDFEARKRLRRWIEGDPSRRESYKAAFILLNLLDFVHGEKKKLEYIDRISADARIHAYYKAHGASSFRLSSSPNLQNFPVYPIEAWGGARRDDNETAENPLDMAEEKEAVESIPERTKSVGSLRSIVVADDPDEDLILTCDYEQLQLWLYAKQFNVKWMLEQFYSKDYIYGLVYEKLYHEPFFKEGKARTKENKLKISEQRMRRTKAVPLGFLFGRSAEAVAKEYGWKFGPDHFAHQRGGVKFDDSCGDCLRSWWYGLNPELPQSYSEIKYKLNQQGWLRHCFGQIIHYPSRKLTEAINSHAQSAEAFVVAGSIILIDKEFKRRGFTNTRIMLQVHDSISCNVAGARKFPSRMVQVAEEIIFPILGRPLPQLSGFQLRYSAEVSTMWDWEVVSYKKWKEEALGPSTLADVSTGAPGIRGS